MCKNANALLSSEKASFLRKHSMSEIQEMERKYHELELEQTQKMQRVSELKRDVRNAQSRVDKLKSAVCEHCGKVSDHSYKIIQEDKETIKNLGIDIEVFQKQVKALDKELDSTRVPFSLQDFDLIEKVKSFEAELLVVEDHVKDQRTLCESRLSEMSTASKGYDLMRFWETAFSEQGLVKYVIRNILSFFNERSNYYLGFLTGGNFSIDFDDSLHETILNRSKLAFFDTLSGGEKKKISLSVMLALNDLLLLTGKERSNVVFFDEIADSLDEEGIRGLYELIQQITQSKRLFIITHNDYLTSLIEDKADVLEVRKKDYITTVRKP